jgi:hypothetical protein
MLNKESPWFLQPLNFHNRGLIKQDKGQLAHLKISWEDLQKVFLFQMGFLKQKDFLD